MNQMEHLEIQLRAWQPRRPSPKCKTALFGKKSEDAVRSLALLWNWSLPIAASMVLLLATLGQRGSDLARVASLGNQGPMIATVLSNQSFAAFWPGNPQNDQNTLRNTFEWTNASRYTPSIAPLIH